MNDVDVWGCDHSSASSEDGCVGVALQTVRVRGRATEDAQRRRRRAERQRRARVRRGDETPSEALRGVMETFEVRDWGVFGDGGEGERAR